MAERHFEDSAGAKAIGFSHGDLGFVVEDFHCADANQFLCAEVAEGLILLWVAWTLTVQS